MIGQIALTGLPPAQSARIAAPRQLTRRAALGGLVLACAAWTPETKLHAKTQPSSRDLADWTSFQSRFVTLEGRIVDTGNANISHSEGQGVGLLGAAAFGDQAEFDRIHDWTRRTLKRRGDALHAWRYRPNASIPVDDPNNATDGDLLIGLALFMADDRWPGAGYRAAGRAIAADVLDLLVRRTEARTVLLPGAYGFEHPDEITVNPSYYVFPALARFAQEVPNPVWRTLWNDGLALLHDARFGRWNLPPDWTALSRASTAVAPSGKWPPRYSFDAVRVPLYMCWGGMRVDGVLDAAKAFWAANGGAGCPAWVNVRTGETAPYKQTGGMLAIQRYVVAATGGHGRAQDLPAIAEASDYYSAALGLLVRVAEAASSMATS